MPVSHELRCLFLHVPRTGGTSIEAALGMGGDLDVEDEDRLFGRIRSEKYRALGLGSDFFQHLTLREVQSLGSTSRSRDYFSFAVVRNPWDRAVSVYARLVAGKAGVLAERLGVNDPSGLSFEAFLELAEGCAHPHLTPQVDYLVDASGKIAVDLVGRFEALGESFDEVRQRLGRPDLTLPHVCLSVSDKRIFSRASHSRGPGLGVIDVEASIYLFGEITRLVINASRCHSVSQHCF